MIVTGIMLAAGFLLNAFFSGIETGLYRVSRMRLVLDSRGGDLVARGLLYLTNNPSLFVATTLIGNNLANYIISLAIVLIAQELFAALRTWPSWSLRSCCRPSCLSTGELLPKRLFLLAPHRLVRRGGPLLLLFVALFLPVALVLWGMGRLVRYVLGESPEHVRLTLARRELARVFDEGHEAGILNPVQRSLAQNLFATAESPVAAVTTPLARVVSVPLGARAAAVADLAARRLTPVLPVRDGGELVGYVRMIDLALGNRESVDAVRPLITIPQTDNHLSALMTLQAAGEMMARVVNERGETVGVVTLRQLHELLFRGG